MSRARTALVLPLALTGLLGTAALAPAEAATRTTSYAIPGDAVYPEGIATAGNTFYVTATSDGTLFRGTTTSRALSVWKQGGTDGRTTAIGARTTPDGRRLLVAGGATGGVWVYDTATKALVARYSSGLSSGTFVNDIALDRQGNAYVTDSQNPALYRIPAAQIAAAPSASSATVRPLPVFRSFTGTPFQYDSGFNANGIVLTPDGKALDVVQSGTGKLFRVDLASKAVRQVDLGGRTLVNGDGLRLRGDVLYAVRNANGVISKVKLSADGAKGTVYGQIESKAFRYPTGADVAGGQLLVVNSQFDKRSSGATPEPFTVTGLTNP